MTTAEGQLVDSTTKVWTENWTDATTAVSSWTDSWTESGTGSWSDSWTDSSTGDSWTDTGTESSTTDLWTDSSSDSWTDAWTDSWTDSWTDTWTNSTDGVVVAAPPANKTSMVMVYVQVLLSPFIFIGNIMILLAIRRSKSMKKVTYLFLGHLAVADLFFGVGMWMRFFLIITKNSEKYPCMFTQCFVLTAGGASETGILYLCLEGYLSVKYFMTFKRVFTPRLAWGLIIACWAFWIFMSLLSIIVAVYSPVKKAQCFLGGGYYEPWYLALWPTLYFLHLFLVVYFQLGTILITRKHFSHLNPKKQQGRNTQPLPGQDSAQKRRLARLANMSKIVGFVLTVFFVCWTPGMGGMFFFATCKKDCMALGKILLNLASLILVSSFMNVVIYGIKSPEFRRGFRRMLCRSCNRVGAMDSEISRTMMSSHTQGINTVGDSNATQNTQHVMLASPNNHQENSSLPTVETVTTTP